MNRLIALLSWAALIELPALGWRLQGWLGVLIGAVLGVMFWNWAHDWEVRALIKKQNSEKIAGRL